MTELETPHAMLLCGFWKAEMKSVVMRMPKNMVRKGMRMREKNDNNPLRI